MEDWPWLFDPLRRNCLVSAFGMDMKRMVKIFEADQICLDSLKLLMMKVSQCTLENPEIER